MTTGERALLKLLSMSRMHVVIPSFKKTTRIGACIVIAGACFAMRTMAEEAFAPAGEYDYRLEAVPKGQAACNNHWRFNDDGTLVVRTGQRVATVPFRFVKAQTGVGGDLFIKFVDGEPPCVVHGGPDESRGEQLIVVYPNMAGDVILCMQIRNQDGRVVAIQPFGSLHRSPKAEKPPTGQPQQEQ